MKTVMVQMLKSEVMKKTTTLKVSGQGDIIVITL